VTDPGYVPGLQLLSGNEACAEGAIYAGCRFFAGYPITPSTEIAERLATRLPQVGGWFIQMEDEIASMGAVLGASLAGAKAMTATSGPGFSLKQENIGYGCMAEIPCVVVNVMRGGPSTGLPTGPSQSDLMQAKWGTHGDHPTIAITPDSVQEIFAETIRAFNIAERLRTPVILLTDEVIAHMREKVVLPKHGRIKVLDRLAPQVPPGQYFPYEAGESEVPPMASFGEGYRFHVTGLAHDDTGFPIRPGTTVEHEIRRLKGKIEAARDFVAKWDEYRAGDADVLVVAYGVTARAAKAAVDQARASGIAAGLFRPITIWPFPDEKFAEAALRVRAVLVPEMNLGQLTSYLLQIVRRDVAVVPLSRVDGEPITPGQILGRIRDLAGA
jgi:2-oxoglutarate ferredoxin oxidoreductase subunit alpha